MNIPTRHSRNPKGLEKFPGHLVGDSGDKRPRVTAVTAMDDHTLHVRFDNDKEKKYDIAPLLNWEMFAPLRDARLFRSVRVERGGYAVIWNNEMDISEHELWTHGETMPT